MLVLADFFDSLLRGTVLGSLSLVLGSVAWAWWVLRATQGRASVMVVARCLTLMEAGAGALAVCQALLLTFKAQCCRSHSAPARSATSSPPSTSPREPHGRCSRWP
jgi:hypothetical protein